MTSPMDYGQAATRLDQLRAVAPFPACSTCECLQGYLAQLQLLATDDAAALVAPLRVARTEMHSCLGCDPCPPGDLLVALGPGTRSSVTLC